MLAHVEGMRTAERAGRPPLLQPRDEHPGTDVLPAAVHGGGATGGPDRKGEGGARSGGGPGVGWRARHDPGRVRFGGRRGPGLRMLGGTGYPVFEVEAQTRVRTEQVFVVERLANLRAPGCTPDELKAADAEPNTSYRRAAAEPWECTSCSDRTGEGASSCGTHSGPGSGTGTRGWSSIRPGGRGRRNRKR